MNVSISQLVAFFERKLDLRHERPSVDGAVEEFEINGVRYIVMAGNRSECLAHLSDDFYEDKLIHDLEVSHGL